MYYLKVEYPENEFHMETDNLQEFKETFLKSISDTFDMAVSSDLSEIKNKEKEYRKINKELITGIIDKAIGQYYDLETIVWNNNLNYISMSPHDLKQSRLKKYQHVKLVNINGIGIGQVHFITDDNHYLLLPWCYIVSMIPSKEKVRNSYGFI